MAALLLGVLGTGLVDPGTAVLRADDEGATRGDGCFEGIRVVTDADGHSHAAKLDRHLDRMARSARALGLPFDAGQWQHLVGAVCAALTDPAPGEAALKLVLTRGPAGLERPTGYALLSAVSPDYPRLRAEGIRAITLSRGLAADAFTSAPWLLGGVKTLSYAVNMAALREAARLGAQDAFFVSSDGFVLEAPTASIVWSNGRTLRTTPRGATGILAGTTQDLVFECAAAAGWDCGEQLVTVEDLHAAEGLWSVSSVRGPVEVVDLDGRQRTRLPEVDRELRRWAGF